jgi:hypothetical protein
MLDDPLRLTLERQDHLEHRVPTHVPNTRVAAAQHLLTDLAGPRVAPVAVSHFVPLHLLDPVDTFATSVAWLERGAAPPPTRGR